MCDCRVCTLEFMYPEEAGMVIDDVFEYMVGEE